MAVSLLPQFTFSVTYNNFYLYVALWTQYLYCNAVYTIVHCVQCSSLKAFERKDVQTSFNFQAQGT
jgi:hypothetical protein